MVESQSDLDLVFRALGDRTRRAMLRRLARREHTVGELAEQERHTLPDDASHIRSLEEDALDRRTGSRIDPRPLERADDWLRAYEKLWDTRLERLAELLRHPDNDDPSPQR